jgi:cytochrome c oxidase cbb3-type subunit 4
MHIAALFDKVSSAMTVISFLTFVGILWWTFVRHKDRDFAAAAQLPFADDDVVATTIPAAGNRQEQRHV